MMRWHQRNSSVYLIVNPVAKRFSEKSFKRALENLRKRLKGVEVLYTSQRGDAERFSREISNSKDSVVVVVGGDGTLNEAINGLVGTETPLGFIPSGTTNVAAKEFGILEDYEGAITQLLEAEPKKISLGYVNGRYFLLMIGAGFDGHAVYEVNPKIKRLWGKGAYILSGIGVFLKDDLEEIEVTVNGVTYRAGSVIVANASCYGGRFKVCPGASVFKDELDVCVFLRRDRRALVRYIAGIVVGRHLRFSDVVYLKTKGLRIGGNTHMQIDGDYLGIGPAEVKVVSRCVTFLMPK